MKKQINEMSRVLIAQLTDRSPVILHTGTVHFDIGMHGVSKISLVRRDNWVYDYKPLKEKAAIDLLIKRGHITKASFWQHRKGYASGIKFYGCLEGQPFEILYSGMGIYSNKYLDFGHEVQVIPTETMVSLFEAAGSAGMPMPSVSAYKFIPKEEYIHLF